MEMCSRCKNAPAMVYITRQDQNGTKSEGICYSCAKELGIKLPPNLENAGDLLQSFNESMQSMMEGDDGQGKAPMIISDIKHRVLFLLV